MLDPVLPVDQRVKEGPAHSYRLCTKTQGLDDVGASSDAAVDVNFEMLEDLRMMPPNLKECQ
jgi:hypothetical protein